MQTSLLVSPGRVEDGHGSLGHAATLRFRSPLIELEVRISRIWPAGLRSLRPAMAADRTIRGPPAHSPGQERDSQRAPDPRRFPLNHLRRLAGSPRDHFLNHRNGLI